MVRIVRMAQVTVSENMEFEYIDFSPPLHPARSRLLIQALDAKNKSTATISSLHLESTARKWILPFSFCTVLSKGHRHEPFREQTRSAQSRGSHGSGCNISDSGQSGSITRCSMMGAGDSPHAG
jgi:hypothetical protein